MNKKIAQCLLIVGVLASPLLAQSAPEDESESVAKTVKPHPPRIPDGPFVPKKGMIARDKDQFWAGSPEEGRFVQILTLILVPREQLDAKLQEWPPYPKLTDPQKARLVERLDEVREQSRREALEVAKDFKLAVTPEKEDAFVRTYWTEKVAVEQSITKELSPMRKKLEDEARKRIETQYKSDTKK